MSRRERKAMILSLVLSLGTLSLATGVYATYAWFASSGEVSISNLAIAAKTEELSVGAFYKYSLNDGQGYHLGDAHFDGNDPMGTYFSETVNSAINLKSAPTYATTYCAKINNASNSPIDVLCRSTGYETVASTKNAHIAETVALRTGNRTYTAGQGFDILDLVRVYSYFTTDPVTNKTAIESFLQTPFGNGGNDATNNRFGLHTTLTSSATEDFSTTSTMTIPPSGNETFYGYLFLTFYFSNDSSTFYVEGETDQGITSWSQNSNTGVSNPYEGLSLTFNPIELVAADE